MNERIVEMMRNHGLHKHISTDCQHRMEMLAELIVRKCAEQVDWILAEGGKTQGDLIKEHFGVES